MTKRLEQLCLSFGNIIIDYCKTQFGTKKGSPEGANTSIDYMERLIRMIPSDTDRTDRVSLLHYLLYGVTLLKPLIEQQDSRVLSEREVKHLRAELVQMLCVMQQLLHLSQGSQREVHYGEHSRQSLSLYGCLRMGGLLSCTSGRIITTKLFLAINLSIDAPESKIKQYIDDAINEYWCELLLQENKSLSASNSVLLRCYNDKTLELYQAQDDITELKEALIKASLMADSSARIKKKPGSTQLFSFSFFQSSSDSDDADSLVSVDVGNGDNFSFS